MNDLLEFLPDAYLHAMADYYAAQRPPLPPRAIPIVSQDVLTLGQSLVIHGDPGRGIPACSGCHGSVDYKTGSAWLEGEPAVYLVTQLKAFRSGARHNDISQQMRNIARGVSPAEIEAAALYYASQP